LKKARYAVRPRIPQPESDKELISRSQLQNLQVQELPFDGSVLTHIRPQFVNVSPVIMKKYRRLRRSEVNEHCSAQPGQKGHKPQLRAKFLSTVVIYLII
jgi:hypothetical protein